MSAAEGTPYGYCPECGLPGAARARDMIGTTMCGRGHSWVPMTPELYERLVPADPVKGITFLLFRHGRVLLEQCPKKREVLGVGEWFVPGGKLEPGEIAADACRRELREELGVEPYGMRALPVLEGSPVPPGPRGLFLMRPYVVAFDGRVPERTLDGAVLLRWTPIAEALSSPVPQVRMMVAAAFEQHPGGPFGVE